MTTATIRTFSQATAVLEAHGRSVEKARGKGLWLVGVEQLDKGGVIALARTLGPAPTPGTPTLEQPPIDLDPQLLDRLAAAGYRVEQSKCQPNGWHHLVADRGGGRCLMRRSRIEALLDSLAAPEPAPTEPSPIADAIAVGDIDRAEQLAQFELARQQLIGRGWTVARMPSGYLASGPDGEVLPVSTGQALVALAAKLEQLAPTPEPRADPAEIATVEALMAWSPPAATTADAGDVVEGEIVDRFDLAALSLEDRIHVEQSEREIARLRTTIRQSVIAIGRELIDIRRRLKAERSWLAYLRDRIGISDQSAENYIAAAQLAEHSPKFLEFEDRIAKTAMYELGAASTPPAARDAALGLLEAGEKVGPAVAKQLIAEHSPAPATPQLPTIPDDLAGWHWVPGHAGQGGMQLWPPAPLSRTMNATGLYIDPQEAIVEARGRLDDRAARQVTLLLAQADTSEPAQLRAAALAEAATVRDPARRAGLEAQINDVCDALFSSPAVTSGIAAVETKEVDRPARMVRASGDRITHIDVPVSAGKYARYGILRQKGELVVHDSPVGEFAISHVGTGRLIARCQGIEQARHAQDVLAALDWNFSTINAYTPMRREAYRDACAQLRAAGAIHWPIVELPAGAPAVVDSAAELAAALAAERDNPAYQRDDRPRCARCGKVAEYEDDDNQSQVCACTAEENATEREARARERFGRLWRTGFAVLRSEQILHRLLALVVVPDCSGTDLPLEELQRQAIESMWFDLMNSGAERRERALKTLGV